MKSAKVRWGILGTGRIARQFAEDFAFVGNGELVAVASRTQAAADRFAARHRIGSAHRGYQALFDDPRIDAVYIATPHSLHADNCIDAMRAGKHVLCEKPLTVDARECRALIRAAEDRSVFLMEAMWTWFLPAVRRALEWVGEGRIGQLRHLKADFGYPQLPFDPARREYAAELGGGCLLEMGIYPIALAWLFIGRDPVTVKAVRRTAPNGVEDDVSILFDYSPGEPDCTATPATSFRCKLQNWAYIVGDEGYIAIPDFWRARECRLYRLDERIDEFRDERKSLGFDFETTAAGADILAGRQQNDIVPWSASLRFQEHIERVRQAF